MPPATALKVVVAERDFDDVVQVGTERRASTCVKDLDAREARDPRHLALELAIRQRIESRLPARVRNLIVRVLGDIVILEGQCSTYYTKQLAQHAALGILNDEHLENAIVVNVST